MSKTIILPVNVYEQHLLRFANTLNSYESEKEIIIDITNCRRYTPASILLLLGVLFDWREQGYKTKLKYNEDSEFFRYLQRMNFFNFFSFENPEDFKRHAPGDRFIPIVEFGPDSRNDQEIDKNPDELAKALSNIAITKTSVIDDPKIRQLKTGIAYSCGELIMNVIQHANSCGYVFAQYNEYKDYVRIAILDKGIGIKGSFERQNSEHYDEKMSDLDAIEKALEYKVSSKPIGPRYENAGVGLTFLNGICREAGRDFTIISNKAYYGTNKVALNATNFINGTLVTLTLVREQLCDFNNIFRKAQSL